MEKFINVYNDLIMEEILPSPWLLIEDILKRIKNEDKIQYSKSNLLKLSDKSWKFYEDLKNVNTKFSLIIIKSNIEDAENIYNIEINESYKMLHFLYKDKFTNFIWVNKDDEINESFKNYLKHELGHVWTYLKEIKQPIGIVSFENSYNRKNIILNPLQMHTLKNIYKGNEDLLKSEFKYILTNDENNENYELAPVIDQILELLVNDYLTYNNDISTQKYIDNLFLNFLSFNLKNLTLVKNFKNYSHLEKILYARLFLIMSFGTEEQLNYFKEACIDEFGELKNEN